LKKIIGAASVVTAIFFSGCAGRAPQPVAVVQPQDRYANCAAIAAEVQANNQKVGDLGGEEGGKVAQNVAAGVVGLVVWPLWFAMDFQGAAGKEVSALQSRQQYLAVLAEERHCGSPSLIPPAVAVSLQAPVTPAGMVAPTAPVPLPAVAAVSPSPAPAATADYPPYNSVPSVTPTVPGAAPDTNSYEQAQQQYRQAEQQYQRQLELQRAQQGR
jgi:hypothetical protein